MLTRVLQLNPTPPDEDTLLVSTKHYTGIKDSLRDEGAVVEEIEERDSRAVVVRFPEEENTAYVGFPGLTDGRHGLKRILSSAKGDLAEIDMEGDCHGGVLPYYLSLRETLIENLETLQRNSVNRFVFTGHCLGGAKATFAVADFLNRQVDQDISVDLITFAQIPAVLPVEVARTLTDDPRLESKNLWLENDLWKGLSSRLDRWRGFVHLSERTEIASAQREWWWNTHRLKTYIEALEHARSTD